MNSFGSPSGTHPVLEAPAGADAWHGARRSNRAWRGRRIGEDSGAESHPGDTRSQAGRDVGGCGGRRRVADNQNKKDGLKRSRMKVARPREWCRNRQVVLAQGNTRGRGVKFPFSPKW